VTLMIASVGFSILGSGTVSTLTVLFACQVTALIGHLHSGEGRSRAHECCTPTWGSESQFFVEVPSVSRASQSPAAEVTRPGSCESIGQSEQRACFPTELEKDGIAIPLVAIAHWAV
jgi:hypothetical protein